MNKNISNTLAQLIFGTPVGHLNLMVVPVFLPENLKWTDYISLKEGLDQKLVEVSEVSESGSVPNLMVTNNADLPLLLLDGEELIGAKQNRIVNTSLLLPSKTKTVIPVSCTERGRWDYNSRFFGDSGVIMSSKARYNKSERVKSNLERGAGYNAQQNEVWNDIEGYHDTFNSSSKSRAMRDIFYEQQTKIDGYLQNIPVQSGQCGLVVILGGSIAGFDFVSSPQAYTSLHNKLISSYAIEALVEKVQGKERSLPEAEQAVLTIKHFITHFTETASENEFKPVGLGVDYRYTAPKGTASALAFDNKVVHFSAFPNISIEVPVKQWSDSVETETQDSGSISKTFLQILKDKLSKI
ncbi:MAG: hypothetical protein IPM47_02950 [Sphingobacteriales bacterium]|nr:MAG: hypothetical protein IPM47_02950 [Sphingobacteriales bacterium]